MTQVFDELTREYLLQWMRESPNELLSLVRRLIQWAAERERDLGRLADVTTRVLFIEELWQNSQNDDELREYLLDLMRKSPDDLIEVARDLIQRALDELDDINKLSDMATQFMAIKRLWQVFQIQKGEDAATGA